MDRSGLAASTINGVGQPSSWHFQPKGSIVIGIRTTPFISYRTAQHSLKLPSFTPRYRDLIKYLSRNFSSSDKFEPTFFSDKTDIYVNVGNKIVKCKNVRIKDHALKNMTLATSTRLIFDGHLYNEKVEYILVYYLDGVKYTAFIDSHGFIGNEWSLAPNSFGKNTVTSELIEKTLEHYGYTKIFSNYVCFKRVKNDFEVAFKKST